MKTFKKPDFLIVGAQKSGTTTLHYSLSAHKNIFMSNPKELNFFHNDDNYKKGINWYSQHFANCRENQIAGESSPEYIHYNIVPGRIAALLPNVKIIILLRNPIDRAYSAYWHAVRHAGEHLNFESAIEIEQKRIRNDSYAEKYYSYLTRGNYISSVREYFNWFPADNISIIIAEDYFQNPVAIIKILLQFLSLDYYSDFLEIAPSVLLNKGRALKSRKVQRFYVLLKLNFPFLETYFPVFTTFFSKLNRAGDNYSPLSYETRKLLWDYYNNSICELENFTGRQITNWSMNT
jgi:hypothetical protein